MEEDDDVFEAASSSSSYVPAHSSSSAESKANISAQIETMRTERAAQTEKKLAFLLQQSDIFSHFGVDSSKVEDAPSRKKKDASRRRMTETEGDREDLKSGDGIQGTRLTKQPSCVQGEMRPYQLEGLNWLIRNHENGINGILADEMGLGKTLQSISILGYMYEFEQNEGPYLVLVPKSTMANWMNEIKRWCPSLTGIKFHGSKDERQVMINDVLRPGQRDDQRDWCVAVTGNGVLLSAVLPMSTAFPDPSVVSFFFPFLFKILQEHRRDHVRNRQLRAGDPPEVRVEVPDY